MKAIFLGLERGVKKVYGEELIQRLIDITNVKFEVFTKEKILSGQVNPKEAEIAFATWGMQEYSEAEIKEYFPNLKAIFYAAGSVQRFAKPFLNCGVKVFSAWAANAVPVAEYTTAQIILANKGFFKTQNYKKSENFERMREFCDIYPGNYGAKVGILGAGMIGKLVLKKLMDYDVEVLVFDAFVDEAVIAKYGARKASLEEIFKECNVVSNHLADNPKTQGMITGELLASMPKYATFINTGRGAQVKENEMIEVLKKRDDITALLDVTEPEPPVNSSELYTLPNCILTPHIAGSGGKEIHRMAQYMIDEYIAFSKGEATSYEVTLKMLETMA
ncbi:MAG: hydroxyacid dehydrogenase [Ruminococcaceae bacterium]|nr:hydroxyacid dehydrogenase [Oscillospiraceae bacterium]